MAMNNKMRTQRGNSYGGMITREQFLFHEMRTTAGLYCRGLSHEEIIQIITDENLFQYPSEKTIKNIAGVCLKRLDTLEDEGLIEAIATESASVAKQICLYAMIRQYPIVRDFMIHVIGEKYRTMNLTYSKADLNMFFFRLQEQDDRVAAWSDATVQKIKQVLHKLLVDVNYLETIRSTTLQPIWISSVLETAIRAKGDTPALAAFNCF